MTDRDLTAIMRPYAPGTWLLLSPDGTRVLGSGTAKEAMREGGYDPLHVDPAAPSPVLFCVPGPDQILWRAQEDDTEQG